MVTCMPICRILSSHVYHFMSYCFLFYPGHVNTLFTYLPSQKRYTNQAFFLHSYMCVYCLKAKIWVTVVYRLIKNGLEFWCGRMPKWLITSIRTTNRCYWADTWRYFIFCFNSNMINNGIIGYTRVLLKACR